MQNKIELLVLGTQKSSGKNGKSVKTKISYAYGEEVTSTKKGLQVLKEDWLDDNGKLFDILIPNKLYAGTTSYKRTFGTQAVEVLESISDLETGECLYSR